MKVDSEGKCLQHGRFMCCHCRYGRKPNNNEREPEVKDCLDFINEKRYVTAEEQ